MKFFADLIRYLIAIVLGALLGGMFGAFISLLVARRIYIIIWGEIPPWYHEYPLEVGFIAGVLMFAGSLVGAIALPLIVFRIAQRRADCAAKQLIRSGGKFDEIA